MSRKDENSTGNTDDSKRGREITPDGREPGKGPLSGLQAGEDGVPKRAEDYGGGPIGGRHKKNK